MRETVSKFEIHNYKEQNIHSNVLKSSHGKAVT